MGRGQSLIVWAIAEAGPPRPRGPYLTGAPCCPARSRNRPAARLERSLPRTPRKHAAHLPGFPRTPREHAAHLPGFPRTPREHAAHLPGFPRNPRGSTPRTYRVSRAPRGSTPRTLRGSRVPRTVRENHARCAKPGGCRPQTASAPPVPPPTPAARLPHARVSRTPSVLRVRSGHPWHVRCILRKLSGSRPSAHSGGSRTPCGSTPRTYRVSRTLAGARRQAGGYSHRARESRKVREADGCRLCTLRAKPHPRCTARPGCAVIIRTLGCFQLARTALRS